MCGIAGWIDWNRDITKETSILKNMSDTLKQRGPDESGMWLSTHAGLVHRRLVVIDPDNGRQPMIRYNNGKKYILIYNGELYNADEIREELIKKNYEFEGHSDTEVLLNAYIEWGEKCVEHFNGIYAFAIWDDYENKIFASRDRMGVKPFFYAYSKDKLIFGSELKTLLAHPDVEPTLDLDGLLEMFLIGPARIPNSGVFKGIYALKPGYSMTYDRNGLKLYKYWEPKISLHNDDFDVTAQKIKYLVTDAIKRQLVSDVPVCTFLSGGLDSGLISTIASNYYRENGKGQLSTYSIDYVDNSKYFKASKYQPNEDAPWVVRLSQYLKTNHTNVVLDTKELFSALYDATKARDLPGMADVDSSLFLFCREIKKNATVALSGECADEIFGGYPWFYREEMLNSTTFPWSRAVDKRAELLSKDINVDKDYALEYVKQQYDDSLSEIDFDAIEDKFDRKMKKMRYLNLKWFMTTLLDRKDRMSMASGLEVRVPFCDHRIVDYVWNIPWEMLYYRKREKGLLRHAFEGVLPEDVLWRKKSPYPKTYNPLYNDMVKSMLQDIINNPESPLLQVVDKGKIQEMIDTNGASFGRQWFGQLMSSPQIFAYFIQINIWMKEYKVKIV